MTNLNTFKAIAERAVNSPKIAEITDANAALDELRLLNLQGQMQGNRHLSPFGHNATATNGDIDFALCRGERLLDDVIDKVSRFKKTRKADYSTDRGALAKCVDQHLKFLSGRNNGKNRLADRLIRFMGEDKMAQAIEMEAQIHAIMSPIYDRMHTAYLATYK